MPVAQNEALRSLRKALEWVEKVKEHYRSLSTGGKTNRQKLIYLKAIKLNAPQVQKNVEAAKTCYDFETVFDGKIVIDRTLGMRTFNIVGKTIEAAKTELQETLKARRSRRTTSLTQLPTPVKTKPKGRRRANSVPKRHVRPQLPSTTAQPNLKEPGGLRGVLDKVVAELDRSIVALSARKRTISTMRRNANAPVSNSAGDEGRLRKKKRRASPSKRTQARGNSICGKGEARGRQKAMFAVIAKGAASNAQMLLLNARRNYGFKEYIPIPLRSPNQVAYIKAKAAVLVAIDAIVEQEEREATATPRCTAFSDREALQKRRAVFEFFDEDGSGSICVNELKMAINEMRGGSIKVDDVTTLCQWADINQDGVLDFGEWCDIMNQLEKL